MKKLRRTLAAIVLVILAITLSIGATGMVFGAAGDKTEIGTFTVPDSLTYGVETGEILRGTADSLTITAPNETTVTLTNDKFTPVQIGNYKFVWKNTSSSLEYEKLVVCKVEGEVEFT